MKKVWADKSLGITPDDKFIKPSEWTDGCSGLHGMGGGYGDEGNLQTIEELRTPRIEVPVEGTARKEENVNEKINKGEDIDFNK